MLVEAGATILQNALNVGLGRQPEAETENYRADGQHGYHQSPAHMSGRMTNDMAMTCLMFYIVLFVLLLIFGKTLWNEYLVEMFHFVKPIDSVFSLVALSIMIKLLGV